MISPSLIKQLQESIEKIESGGTKSIPHRAISSRKMTSSLKIDEGSLREGDNFSSFLIDCLQSGLDLPENGSVKVELTLKNNGSFVRMKVLKSESSRNQKFLEGELHALKYPPFSGSLKNEKEHTFVITFCNE